MQKISVIGLGKLGTPLLATLADRGFNVVGVDTNHEFVKKINSGISPVDEPGVGTLIKNNQKRIAATSNYQEAIDNTEASFIIVPTPSIKSGAFTNKYVVSAARSVARALKTKRSYHLVVIVSTIMPRSMDAEIIPTLKNFSGKRIGVDFGVCYNPEFIALGSVVNNLRSPDLVLIGELDKKSGDALEEIYKKLCINKPAVSRMSFVNAEITKIALNSFITTKISFANTLAQICEATRGGDVNAVTGVLGQDTRIGPKYLKGALPYGGPCFPRDNRAFSYFARKQKVIAPIAKASDNVNENLIRSLTKDITSLVKRSGKVGILGLAYKKDTDVAEESAGVKLANQIAKSGKKVLVWDPKALDNAGKYLSPKVKIAASMEDCVKSCDIIAITTPWGEFQKIKPGWFKTNPHKKILIDYWQVIDRKDVKEKVEYKTFGKGKP